MIRYRTDAIFIRIYLKNGDGFTLVKFASWNPRWNRETTHGGIYFRYIPGAPRSRQFFHFPVAIRGRGAYDIRPSAFTSFQLCWFVLPARLSVILRTRLSVHSFSPLVPRHATPRCFHPFHLPAFSFLSSTTPFLFNRYYAVPAPDRENWEIQQRPNNPWDFSLVAFVLPPLQTSPSSPPLRISPAILFTHFHSRGQRNNVNKDSAIHVSCKKGENGENTGNHPWWWSLYRAKNTSIIENILAIVWSIRKRGSISLGRSLIHAWLRTATLAQIYDPIKVRCCGSSNDSLNCRVLMRLVVHRRFNYWSRDNDIDLNQKDWTLKKSKKEKKVFIVRINNFHRCWQ